MEANKRVVYVGGLGDNIDTATLHSAFIPFGEIKDVQLPIDKATRKNRGFGFVQFQLEEDAQAATDNMHGAELFGRTLKVLIARPQRNKLGSSRAVWDEESDKFLKDPEAQPQVPSTK